MSSFKIQTKTLAVSIILLATILTLMLKYDTQVKLVLYSLQQPCGIYFSDLLEPWDKGQKDQVIKACKLYKKVGGWSFSTTKPLYLFVDNGPGGAYTNTTNNSIVFVVNDEQKSEDMYPISLHEFAHIIDANNGLPSHSKKWLDATGWTCESIKDSKKPLCSHPCMQDDEKAFFCSYKLFETLPSRFGTDLYNPDYTDVSINPTEDFAESSRYFLQANDELALTSPSRCNYFKNLFSKVSNNPCFDCNPGSLCQGNNWQRKPKQV